MLAMQLLPQLCSDCLKTTNCDDRDPSKKEIHEAPISIVLWQCAYDIFADKAMICRWWDKSADLLEGPFHLFDVFYMATLRVPCCNW